MCLFGGGMFAIDKDKNKGSDKTETELTSVTTKNSEETKDKELEQNETNVTETSETKATETDEKDGDIRVEVTAPPNAQIEEMEARAAQLEKQDEKLASVAYVDADGNEVKFDQNYVCLYIYLWFTCTPPF